MTNIYNWLITLSFCPYCAVCWGPRELLERRCHWAKGRHHNRREYSRNDLKTRAPVLCCRDWLAWKRVYGGFSCLVNCSSPQNWHSLTEGRTCWQVWYSNIFQFEALNVDAAELSQRAIYRKEHSSNRRHKTCHSRLISQWMIKVSKWKAGHRKWHLELCLILKSELSGKWEIVWSLGRPFSAGRTGGGGEASCLPDELIAQWNFCLWLIDNVGFSPLGERLIIALLTLPILITAYSSLDDALNNQLQASPETWKVTTLCQGCQCDFWLDFVLIVDELVTSLHLKWKFRFERKK